MEFLRFVAVRRAIRVVVIVLTFLLPVTNVLSAAVLILTARHGWRSVFLDAGIGLVALVALFRVTGNAAPVAGLVSAAGLWGGAALGGLLLVRYRSVTLVVQALVIAALAGVSVAMALIPNPRAYWQPILEEVVKAAGLPQAGKLPPDWLGTLAALMHGVIASGLLSTLMLALMLALWMAQKAGPMPVAAGGSLVALDADRPGGWRQQFLELRLGLVLVAISGIAALVLAAGHVTLGGSLLLVLATGFVAQGLSIVHWTAAERRWPRVWPFLLYGLMLLGAPVGGILLLVLAIAGLADNVLPLRRPRPDVV